MFVLLCVFGLPCFIPTFNIEISLQDCSNFQAASAIRSKNKSKKLAETAVFGSTCRHGFPKYFFSLKHGERYVLYILDLSCDVYKSLNV